MPDLSNILNPYAAIFVVGVLAFMHCWNQTEAIEQAHVQAQYDLSVRIAENEIVRDFVEVKLKQLIEAQWDDSVSQIQSNTIHWRNTFLAKLKEHADAQATVEQIKKATDKPTRYWFYMIGLVLAGLIVIPTAIFWIIAVTGWDGKLRPMK